MTGLVGVSAEIMEMIVSLLDFSSISNVRLVSRGISAKSTHGIVKSDFRDETVIWTDSTQVQALVDKTSRGWRGCLMKHLTVVGLIEDEPSVMSTPRLEVTFGFLARILTNIRRHSPHGHLNRLSLRVQRRRQDGLILDSGTIRNWKALMELAARTFGITTRCLIMSGLPVLQLDLFGSDSRRCALASDYLAIALLRLDVQLRPSLRLLTHLSIGMSSTSIKQLPAGLLYNQRGLSAAVEAIHEQNPGALADLLSHCPSLTSLDFRWYRLGRHESIEGRNNSCQRLLSSLSSTSTGRSSLQRLRTLRLRGVYTTETDMLAVLRYAVQLNFISLEEVHLTEGTFEPVFRYMTDESNLDQLREVYVDDAFERGNHVQFAGEGEPHFPSFGDFGPHDITWKSTPPSEPISYSFAKDRALGSQVLMGWGVKRCALYGPPNAEWPCLVPWR